LSIPQASAGTSSTFATAGTFPNAITIDSAGNLYVANRDSNTVSKITPLGVSTVFASTGTSPRGITIDAAGNIYTANYGSNNVTKISPEGVVLNTFNISTDETGPQGIAVDSAGNIYTANFGKGFSATKLNSTGTVIYTAVTDWGPYDIVVDSAGNAYTSNSNDRTISKILPNGIVSKCADTGTSPRDIAIDSSGNLYVAVQGANRVMKILANCGAASNYGNTGTGPFGITLDSAGNVYTVNRTARSVTKLTSENVAWTIGSFTSDESYGIAINSAGNVFVTNGTTNTITKIVQFEAPAFTLSSTTETATVGTSIAGYSINSTGGTVVRYSISPTIENGLSFSTTTGRITGTPTSAASLRTYTITGANENGSASATFGITVQSLSPPAFTISSATETVTAGNPINGYTVNSTGGAISSFSVSPTISNGLSFSTSTGRITGTPSSAASLVTYTITGTNAAGSATATFGITVNAASPPSNDSGPPPLPPPPEAYLFQTSATTLRKVGNAVVCGPGTYTYRIQYFDGTREFSEANTRLSSFTYSFLIDGQVQNSLTASYREDSATVALSSFTGRGLITCLVVAVKNGLSVAGYSSGNVTALAAPLLERYSRISSAAAKYEAAVILNSQRMQIALKNNRETWRSSVAVAQSAFTSSARKAYDSRVQANAIRDAKKAYVDGQVLIQKQLLIDNELALKSKIQEESAADAAYYAALEVAGYGVLLG
jgi:streptogramin lyase